MTDFKLGDVVKVKSALGLSRVILGRSGKVVRVFRDTQAYSVEIDGRAHTFGPTEIALVKPDASRAKAFEMFKPPFRYDSRGTMIWDANHERVVDIRSWGYLSSKLGEKTGAKVQDALGKIVADALNKAWEEDAA